MNPLFGRHGEITKLLDTGGRKKGLYYKVLIFSLSLFFYSFFLFATKLVGLTGLNKTLGGVRGFIIVKVFITYC